MTWTGFGYTHPRTWLFKKEMPKDLQHMATKVYFGIYGLRWVARNHEKAILMPNDEWMATFDFYLTTPGHVIGPRDLQAAAHHSWAMEWRQACGDRQLELVKLKSNL